MINKSFAQNWLARPFLGMAMVVGLILGQTANAAVITLNVEVSNPDTTQAALPVLGFRYLVEEDTTIRPQVNVQDDYESLSFQFHRSHNPVATNAGEGLTGHSLTNTVQITVPDVHAGQNAHYFISVTPFEGHAMGGGAVEIVGNLDVSKTIRVNSFPLPTAQISIWLFEDNNPINGALDIDENRVSTTDIDGQPIPFTINLFDAAGQYGAAGGHVTMDAYGNPLGTEYDAAGEVTSVPSSVNGFVLTPDANGVLIIKNLPPAKYGVQVVPPAGPVGNPIWVQTSTIEGSRTIDAWVKANEPETFVEFGPPGPHVFVGFVQIFDCLNGINTAANCFDADDDAYIAPVIDGATITGQIVNNHLARPPEFGFNNGEPIGGCRIGVNLGIAGRTIYSGACDDASNFSVPNLPPGAYSLSIWDDGLNVVIANHAFSVAGSPGAYVISPVTQLAGQVAGTLTEPVVCNISNECALDEIPVFDWFHFVDTVIFHDTNENGIRDEGEPSLNADASQTILRFRDGRVYTALPIDFEGGAPIEEVFPFFHWLVAEVGFANHKATGATFRVDAGGAGIGSELKDTGQVAAQQSTPTEILEACGTDPLTQPETCSFDNGLSRTDTGPVLTQAFQGFLGQKNVIEWGKKAWGPGENGGISGVAVYSITRAEDDPAFAAAEEWEPGIPRLQVALFESNLAEEIVGQDGSDFQQPDVDNHPLGWNKSGLPGAEDIDRNGNGAFDHGDAIDVTWTDSFDDSQPTNCAGANRLYSNPLDPSTALIDDNKCFDGLRNWNQMRPGVFDGGYAFGGEAPHMDSGYYIVQAYAPPGYELLREEHKNVDFGDEYAVPTLLPPACVGAPHTVPNLLAFVTVEDPAYIADHDGILPDDPANYQDGYRPIRSDAADFDAPFATEIRPLCDARHIRVADGKNAAADFHFLTEVNKAAHVVGGVINDLANEFNPNAPTFGEKFSPPWLPVAFYDYKGHEITRVYTDQFGKYNAMLPSTNTVSIASPSGVAPNMITACMNDGGLIDDPSNPGSRIIDPNFNPQYSQFCYVFQYMPGGTTYLDTPVQQIAAFAAAGKQLDCAAAMNTPLISQVTSTQFDGPYVRNDGSLMIHSPGIKLVPNPSADALSATKFIARDYGFGPEMVEGISGTVELVRENNATLRYPLTNVSWGDTLITGDVDSPNGRFQLVVTSADGIESPMGVTVTVNNNSSRVHEVFPSASDNATPIQDAIDAANPGDTILVTAGVYNEIPIMWKPLYLQGAGAHSTTINARVAPTDIVEQWNDKMDILTGFIGGNAVIDLLDGQEFGPASILFATEGAAGITVVGPRTGANEFRNANNHRSRIDGFTITGASTGGGIFANGFIDTLYISNNLVTGNQGTFSGGVRLGHPALTAEVGGGDVGNFLVHDDADNDNVRIRHNMITQNGAINGAGGGVSIYTGSTSYRVTDNFICGNFAATDGAGIGHLGASSGGRILDNTIIFNQSFRQTPGFETDGGGILIAGKDGLNGAALSDGSGNDIRIERNLIQGNQAGAGDGGGIALRRVNGTDIDNEPSNTSQWNRILVRNNSVVNNVAGLAGGGISLKDAVRVNIDSNTVANNDSTATAGAAFESSATISTPQVAGIVSRLHSAAVAAAIDVSGASNGVIARYGRGFSSPTLNDNIIWHNRSHQYNLNGGVGLGDDVLVLVSEGADLGIKPAPANPNWRLTPRDSLLTDANGYNKDNLDDGDVTTAGTDVFMTEYVNGDPFASPNPAEFTTIQVAPALDEGGNWIDVRYAPLSINDVDPVDGSASVGGDLMADQPSDYHLGAGSVAIDNAQGERPGDKDIDGEKPGENDTLDMGSDEVYP